MDTLQRTQFCQQLSGQVWLTQHQAVAAILSDRGAAVAAGGG
jgi:hypothetical protein